MYVYFNEQGVLTTSIYHGQNVRQGDDFSIAVCFNKEFNPATHSVAISFKLYGAKTFSEKIPLDNPKIETFEKTSSEEVTFDLKENEKYVVYKLENLSSEWVTATSGITQAIINIYDEKNVVSYMGIVDIYVEENIGNDNLPDTNITYRQLDELVGRIGLKVDTNSGTSYFQALNYPTIENGTLNGPILSNASIEGASIKRDVDIDENVMLRGGILAPNSISGDIIANSAILYGISLMNGTIEGNYNVDAIFDGGTYKNVKSIENLSKITGQNIDTSGANFNYIRVASLNVQLGSYLTGSITIISNSYLDYSSGTSVLVPDIKPSSSGKSAVNLNYLSNYYYDKETYKNDFVRIQEEIDGINAAQNLLDIVGTYADLLNYKTEKIHSNDKIEVLSDETKLEATTIYKWTGSEWEYVGKAGPDSYTKAETDEKFATNSDLNIYVEKLNEKVDKEEGKTLTSNDFTNEYKNKVDNFPGTEDVELTTDVELGTSGNNYGVTDKFIATTAVVKEMVDPGFKYLQMQIDGINAAQNLADIVGTYADLLNYDTEKLHSNDKIEVLSDETKENATTIYSLNTDYEWEYIGKAGSDSYTKAEASEKFVAQQEGKGLSSNDYTDFDRSKLADIPDTKEAEIATQISISTSENYKSSDLSVPTTLAVDKMYAESSEKIVVLTNRVNEMTVPNVISSYNGTLNLVDNQIYDLGTITSKLEIAFPSGLNATYGVELDFKTQNVSPTLIYSDDVKFTGDDVVEGVFVPDIYKEYQIIFTYNNGGIKGIVCAY